MNRRRRFAAAVARAVLPALTLALALAACRADAPATPGWSPVADPGLAPVGPVERATVLRVVDGDTIRVDRGRGSEPLRYIGIDTPETVRPNTAVEWMGREAADANRSIVDGREVILERDVSEIDSFGRLLRYVWVEVDGGWLMVNRALVAGGYATAVTFPPDVRWTEVLRAAQAMARDAGVGLWGTPP